MLISQTQLDTTREQKILAEATGSIKAYVS